ncbi:hypothetical protein RJ641_036182 [Dillenia turbinata]|uniref:Uncharacterized protein n=1 Tax=Dillenia turbinata TaxID=194707 RepID=A0AAN8ZGP2_9MAGN
MISEVPRIKSHSFTTYAGRRIVQVVHGEDRAALNIGIGWRGLNDEMERPAFVEFLKKYMATFKFRSIDAETFLTFLKVNVPGIEKDVVWQLWTEGTGIPSDAFEPVSSIYTKILSLANEFKLGRMPKEDEVADWHG